MFKIGWFSTGRDRAAIDLLKVVKSEIERGRIRAEIVFCFCNRELGESAQSDLFLEEVKKQGILPIMFSSTKFEPELRKTNIEEWRKRFDRKIMFTLNCLKRVDQRFEVDLIVLAGYMLVVGPELCQVYKMINLHPALPGGPKGTWQEVIWQLIKNREKESGVMIHLVTPELDAGPPITFCKYKIKEYDFDKIRQQGLKREFPLIVETLKLLASGKLKIGQSPLDLTEVINKKIKAR